MGLDPELDNAGAEHGDRIECIGVRDDFHAVVVHVLGRVVHRRRRPLLGARAREAASPAASLAGAGMVTSSILPFYLTGEVKTSSENLLPHYLC